MLFFKKKIATPTLLRTSEDAALREAYNRIRTNLAARVSAVSHPVIGVTSPAEGEGSAACCENLALSFARLGRRVLLIDADLRAESAPEIFGAAETVGFSELLTGKTAAPLPTDCDGLFVLPRGNAKENPADLLGSAAFPSVLAALREDFDAVFVSLPPVCGVADAGAAAPALTGVVLAMALLATDRREAARAVTSLHDLGATLLGTVTVG